MIFFFGEGGQGNSFQGGTFIFKSDSSSTGLLLHAFEIAT